MARGTKLSENEADIKEVGEWHPGIDKNVLHWESYSMSKPDIMCVLE
jgi:hypothetical protein